VSPLNTAPSPFVDDAISETPPYLLLFVDDFTPDPLVVTGNTANTSGDPSWMMFAGQRPAGDCGADP
jgi:hypothetical protein